MAAIELVTPTWLAKRLDDPNIIVLDGSYYLPAARRDADAEYRARRIPGAARFDLEHVKDASSPLPHMLPSPDEFATAVGLMGIADTNRIVVYDGMGLFASPRVAWTFRTFGVNRVAVLDGGFPAWLAEGHPVETGEPSPREPTEFRARFDDRAVAQLVDVHDALRGGAAQVLDARSSARFTGEEPEPRAGIRSGHMPGAINLHYGSLVREGRLADPSAIETEFTKAGVDPEKPIVTTCGSGVTAAILLLAIERTGRPAPALYDGSWAEWGSRPDTQVVTGPQPEGHANLR